MALRPHTTDGTELAKGSDTLKAQENSLWALHEQIFNDTCRLKDISKKASLKEY